MLGYLYSFRGKHDGKFSICEHMQKAYGVSLLKILKICRTTRYRLWKACQRCGFQSFEDKQERLMQQNLNRILRQLRDEYLML